MIWESVLGGRSGFAMPDKAPRRHAEVLQTSVEENILGQSFHVRRTNATPSDVLADLLVAQAGGDADAATPWVEHVKYVYPNKGGVAGLVPARRARRGPRS